MLSRILRRLFHVSLIIVITVSVIYKFATPLLFWNTNRRLTEYSKSYLRSRARCWQIEWTPYCISKYSISQKVPADVSCVLVLLPGAAWDYDCSRMCIGSHLRQDVNTRRTELICEECPTSVWNTSMVSHRYRSKSSSGYPRGDIPPSSKLDLRSKTLILLLKLYSSVFLIKLHSITPSTQDNVVGGFIQWYKLNLLTRRILAVWAFALDAGSSLCNQYNNEGEL